MDLNEDAYVQCFNCHSNIFRKPSNPNLQANGPICQTCLNYESKQVTSLQQNMQIMQSQINLLRCGFSNELALYRGSTDNIQSKQSIDDLQSQQAQLQKESEQLNNVQTQVDYEMQDEIHQITNTNYQIQEEIQLMRRQEQALHSLSKTKAVLNQQVGDLKAERQLLMGISILSELYPIHFDDRSAFVNHQVITLDNLTPILEIIMHLMEKYGFRSFTINFSQSLLSMKNGVQLPLDNQTRQNTAPWLQLIVKETILLWEYIKQRWSQKTKQSYESYVLPFKIGLQPHLNINGNTLNSEASYEKFIKYFTQNIKFMMDFDFMVQYKLCISGKSGECVI